MIVLKRDISAASAGPTNWRKLMREHCTCGQRALPNQRLAMMLTIVYKVGNKQNVSASICDLLKQIESLI